MGGDPKKLQPRDFREQFLADVANWYGDDAVPEYRDALEAAIADNGGWADDDPEDPPASARWRPWGMSRAGIRGGSDRFPPAGGSRQGSQ